jgi:hypothetical protein
MKPAPARCVTFAAAALLAALQCTRAHAYQDPMRFAAPIDSGGGGGRFFTGSPADAYTCKVCHTGGKAVHLQIAGLPVEGYTPGKIYRISISWPPGLKNVGTDFEITDGAGHPFGTLSMPTRDDLGTVDLCMQVEGGLPDTIVLPPLESSQRLIAAAVSCGGGRSTVDWTAPTPGTDAESLRIGPTAHFNGSLVSSDADGTVAGDDVTDFSRAINLAQQSAPLGRKVSGDCSAAQPRAGSATGVWLMAAIALLLRRRARACAQHDRSARCED